MRAVIKLTDGNHINIEADYIRWDNDFISAWNGENCVAIVRLELVNVAYLSERSR
jgi:hypothetical protein